MQDLRIIEVMVGDGLEPDLAPEAIVDLMQLLDQAGEPQPPAGDLSIALLDDAGLKEIHRRFLDNPATTDVITFPGNAEFGFAGEICISVDRARGEAAQRGIPCRLELVLYLIHGWLHLAGLDDRVDADIAEMRRQEARLLDYVKRNTDLGLL